MTTRSQTPASDTASHDVNFQLADLLAQRIAVQPKQLRRLDLVATGRAKRRADQWHLHLAQNALVQARRRQATAEFAKISREVALERPANILGLLLSVRGFDFRHRPDLVLDDRRGDRFLG